MKYVLSSMPISLLTTIKAYKRTLKAFDNLRRAMFWSYMVKRVAAKARSTWGAVFWSYTVKSLLPKKLGGLRILNMEESSRALWPRWLWHEWASPIKPWVGSETPNDSSDIHLFIAATSITRDDRIASLWGFSWLDVLAHGHCTQHFLGIQT